VLKRAIRTLWIALDELDMMWLPVERSWRLNERHYGALQGLDKAQTAARHGADQVKIWRRSYDIPPPPLAADDPQHPRFERRYAGVPHGELPSAESLKDTLVRVCCVLDVAHRPELRAGPQRPDRRARQQPACIVKMLDNVSDAAIVELNIPTGVPLVYDLGPGLESRGSRYLGDAAAVKARAEAVARQSEATR
jgi:2,3-bisphosphoglycerate-dependent phosphoglycerate mutase